MRTKRKSNRSRGQASVRAAIDALEPRRMLFTVNGTSGADTIEIDFHEVGTFLVEYDVTVNGVHRIEGPAGSGGNSFDINGLGGADDIWIKRVHADDFVTLRPGAGNDTVDVANGSFTNHVEGTLLISQAANEGSDSLFVNDSGSGSDEPINVTATEMFTDDGRVIHGGGFADVLLKVTDATVTLREVYVRESVPNMTIDMGSGFAPNFVTFGNNHVLESSAVPMTIKGANVVNFDDTAGIGGRTLDITPNSVFGKQLINCVSVNLLPRSAAPNLYTFNVTGNPTNFTTIEACPGRVNFGNGFTAPVDVASFSGSFTSKVRGTVEVYDSGITNPTSPFLLQTLSTSGVHQNVRKGNFNLTIRDANIDLQILEASNTTTVFNVAALAAGSDVRLFGGDNNDTLQTVNSQTSSNQFDLDNIFVGDAFFFNGRGGDNLLDLNDSNGTTQFGNPQYILNPGVFGESLGRLEKNGELLLNFFGQTSTRTKLVGSSDNDAFFYAGTPGNRVTITGNAGDDLFSTYDPDLGGGNLPLEGIDAVIDGGTGFNAITVDDTVGVGADRFDMNAAVFHGELNTITYRVGSATRTIGYDDIDSIQIFEGSGAATTNLTSKPTAVQLTVSAGAGNDVVVAGGGDIDSKGWRNTTIGGDGGTDSIVFADQLDAPNNLGSNIETETYSLGTQSLSKGPAGFGYFGFESQQISVGNGESNVTGVNNIIDISAIPANLSTTITGGDLRASTINVSSASRDLDSILSTLTMSMGTLPTSVLNFMDQNEPGTMNYTLTNTQLVRTVPPPGSGSKTFNFSGIGALTLNGSQGGNKKFVVPTTPAGRVTTLNANFSATAFSSFNLASGNVATNLLGRIIVNGGGGASTGVVFDNTLDNSPSNQTINAGVFTHVLAHTSNNVSSIFVQNGGGAGTLDIPRVTIPTFVTGNGAKIVTIGGGNLDANLLSGVTVDGGASITVDDRLDTGNDGYTAEASGSPGTAVTFRKTTPGANGVALGQYGAAILQCNNGDNLVTVPRAGNGVSIFTNGGNDTINVPSTVPFISAIETLEVDTGPENASVAPFGDFLSVNSDANASGAKVKLINNDTIRQLTVNTNGTFVVPTNVAVDIRGLVIPGGVVDMAGGVLLSRPGGPSQATLRTLIARGYNGGAWNGTHASGSINSSVAASSSVPDAVGYAFGSEINFNTVGGFTIGAADTLLRYTRYGDADLNGIVDFDDYSHIDAGFNNNRTGWSNGDFDGNGVVDFDDYSLIDLAFNTQG